MKEVKHDNKEKSIENFEEQNDTTELDMYVAKFYLSKVIFILGLIQCCAIRHIFIVQDSCTTNSFSCLRLSVDLCHS